MRLYPTQIRAGSVSQDWRKPLSGEKSRAYLRCAGRLETAYAMFSVSLDEAIGLRRAGRTALANQLLQMAPALCQRLSRPLYCLLQAMLEHAKHFGTTPNLAPLDPENFQGARSRRVALMNDLFSRVLFTRKSQFLHKISSLSELVYELDHGFRDATDELAGEDCLQPQREWETLDAAHYDLNTCLRETVVVLKSFLHALPAMQLNHFESTLEAEACVPVGLVAARNRHLAHGRMAFLKGQ